MKKNNIILLAIIIFSLPCFANETIVKLNRKFYGPYCGLYCVYAVLQVSDQEIDFNSLLKPKYISTKKGSTLADLKLCLQDNGFHAEAIKRISLTDLTDIASSGYRVILHTRRDLNEDYDHYSLYLGERDEKALVFDPPGAINKISFSELSVLWSGVALIVSDSPINISRMLMPARMRLAIYVAIVLASIIIYHLIINWFNKTELFKSIEKDSFWYKTIFSVVQASGIAGLVIIVAVMYHFMVPNGFLNPESKAIDKVQKVHAGSFISKISEKEIMKVLNSDTLIIDSRFKGDYKLGHLDGAVNIPVNTTIDTLREILNKYPKDTDIVVYCQSAGCPFAKNISLKLKEIGYKKIRIFNGGYNEWTK